MSAALHWGTALSIMALSGLTCNPTAPRWLLNTCTAVLVYCLALLVLVKAVSR